MACFVVRRCVFPGSGTQNGRFWGTEAGGEGGGRRLKGQRGNGVTGQRGTGASGRPEKGHQGKGASGKRGIAAGIYALRRQQHGRCGGLWGRPSSRPAVARGLKPCISRAARAGTFAESRKGLEGAGASGRPGPRKDKSHCRLGIIDYFCQVKSIRYVP